MRDPGRSVRVYGISCCPRSTVLWVREMVLRRLATPVFLLRGFVEKKKRFIVWTGEFMVSRF